MSKFYCEACRKFEDADHVGCVETHDGRLVCNEAQEAELYQQELAGMSAAQRRYEMGGEYGGDRADD